MMFSDDRIYIENKYHKTNEPFNPHERMAYHGYDFDKTTGMEDEEIVQGLENLYEGIKNLPHPVIKAQAVKYVLDHTKIDVNEHDLFVGFWSVNRLANCITSDKWNKDVFENILPAVDEKMKDMSQSGAVGIWPDFDHVVPDWDSVLGLGFSGLLKRAEQYKEQHRKSGTLTPETEAVFEGIIIEYKAIIDLIDRLYRYALTKEHAKAGKIAECLCHIRDGAPQNIYEAM